MTRPEREHRSPRRPCEQSGNLITEQRATWSACDNAPLLNKSRPRIYSDCDIPFVVVVVTVIYIVVFCVRV